jgi:O-methyltransferase
MKKIIKKIFNILGFQINRYFSYVHVINSREFIPVSNNENDWKINQKAFDLSQNTYDDFNAKCRYYKITQLIKHILKKNKVYDFVECGCWKGHSSYITAYFIKKSKKKIKFHIFDSFEGLSKFTKEDNYFYSKKKSIKDKILNQFKGDEQFLLKILRNFRFIKIYKGWIPNRFREIKNKKFSFVHIDVDQYAPTLQSIEFFYPRLTKGGIIACDDYNSSIFPGAKKAWDKYFKNNNYTFFSKDILGGCYIIK